MTSEESNPLLLTSTETSSSMPSQEHVEVPGMVSIIIPVYNVNYPLFHYTGNCVGSIKEHTKDVKYEIILIDNGSPVKPQKVTDYGVDKVVENTTNEGVAKAWNKGVRISSGEYIVFLNNDTMVFDNWLSDLLEALEKADLIMATPMYGETFSRAVEADKKRSVWEGKPIEESFDNFRDFACVITRKDLFRQIGPFNEDFFAYAEDLDLLRRMDKENLKYFSTKKVNIFHIIGATNNSVPEMAEVMNKSKERLKEIWGE